MIKKILTLTLFVLLASCSDDMSEKNKTANDTIEAPKTSITQTPAEVSYKMISTEEGEDDASLPQGYWQLLISHPEIQGQINEQVKNTVNTRIVELTKEYQCEKHGDYSFASEVRYLDNNVFSMTYEIMWMCPRMPSPDSTIGALNINLNTGKDILLKTEFTNSAAQNSFEIELSGKLKAMQQGNSDCPVKNEPSYFYKTETGLVFVVAMEQHSDSGCISELKLSKAELSEFFKPDSFLLH